MSILARSLIAYRFFEILNRVCLIQSGKFLFTFYFTFVFIVSLVSCLSNSATASNECTSNESLRSCDFEVFGTVQGVFFRKYTQQQATKLDLVGWVKNTETDTVEGHMEGQKSNIDQMKNWLQTTGSPRSKITKVEFTNEKSITKLTKNTFDIRR